MTSDASRMWWAGIANVFLKIMTSSLASWFLRQLPDAACTVAFSIAFRFLQPSMHFFGILSHHFFCYGYFPHEFPYYCKSKHGNSNCHDFLFSTTSFLSVCKQFGLDFASSSRETVSVANNTDSDEVNQAGQATKAQSQRGCPCPDYLETGIDAISPKYLGT